MLVTLRRLVLGLVLIAAASALLLFSDLGSRIKRPSPSPAATPATRPMRVALLQHVSQPALDEGCDGLIAGLADRGWIVGRTLELKRYNAQGDMPVAAAIAKEMVSGGYDLLVTVTTPSTQAVANVNQAGKTRHVFGIVNDPYSAGIGARRDKPLEHPAHLAGFATLQPVALGFKTAREMNPALASVGVVWNPAEANSEAQVKLARAACADLGLKLDEASIENSAGVGEAAAALVSRGVEAIWVPGDGSVLTALEAIVAAAKKGRIPVFTVIPTSVKRGTLFDLGANFVEVGRLTGQLAGDILNGRDPASVPIDNVMPELLMVNRQALAGLKAPWTFSDAHLATARLVVDADGVEQTKAAPKSEVAAVSLAPSGPPNPTGKKWKIAVQLFAENPHAEHSLHGLRDQLKHGPLVEGRDYELKVRSAQNDMAMLNGIFDAAITDGADLFVPFSTPTLQMAAQKVKTKPIVFTAVSAPVAAGVAKTFTDHLPNVTGICTIAPYDRMFDVLAKYFPDIKRLGTLYAPGETGSPEMLEEYERLAKARGFTLVAVGASSLGEVTDAAVALTARPIDAIVQMSDNVAFAGFGSLARAARQARKPLFSINPTMVEQGAAAAVGQDYVSAGEAAALLIERVIRGESPAGIPIALPPKVQYVVSAANATALGMTLPSEFLQLVAAQNAPAPAAKPVAATPPAAQSTPAAANPNPSGKKWKIAYVLYNETPNAEELLAGMKDAWTRRPLVAGRDYEIKLRSAQGDMAAVSGIIDAALTEGADIVVPMSTPTLQLTVQKVKRVPIVFTLVANPMAAGAGRSYTDHLPNVTGVAMLSPFAAALTSLQQHFPAYKRLGTIFCPAEINSVDLKQALEAECKRRGLTLEAVAANTATELPDAALSLVSRPIDVVFQISDNQAAAGFTAIARAARQAQKPLISLNTTTVNLGSPFAFGHDYRDAGEATVALLERVIGGEDPAKMPFVLPPRIVQVYNHANAKAVGMVLPPALIAEADAAKKSAPAAR